MSITDKDSLKDTNRIKPKKNSSVTPRKSVSILESKKESDKFKHLENVSLPLLSTTDGNIFNEVPPNSPASRFIFEEEYKSIPKDFPSLQELELPYVRVVGIKECIKQLGEYFQCQEYQTNLIHFWFLDFLTDCLWKCQDEYLLTDRYQKAVLEWILYFFNLIRDPSQNLSRGSFFRIFKEAISIAEEFIDTGCDLLPTPQELFTLKENEEKIIDPDCKEQNETDSSLSIHSDGEDSNDSYLMLESSAVPEFPEFYKLPKNPCKCDISIGSSVETLSERSLYAEDEEENFEDKPTEKDDTINSQLELTDAGEGLLEEKESLHSVKSDEKEVSSESDLMFEWVTEHQEQEPSTTPNKLTSFAIASNWQTDEDTFKKISIQPVNKTKLTASASNLMKSSDKDLKKKRKNSNVLPLPRSSVLKVETSSTLLLNNEKKSVDALKDEDVMKAWFEYNLWKQRRKDMDDPKKGWMVNEEEADCDEECVCENVGYEIEDFNDEEYVEIKKEWLNYLDKHKQEIAKSDENKFVNYCLLLIIKELVFEYFYESLQYMTIKLAYQTTPNLILEKLLSEEWKIPKKFKDTFVRPLFKPSPQKREKIEKEPKSKADKDKKKEKKQEKSDKTSSKASSKKDKSSKGKSEKAVKQHDKPEKLSAEEKEKMQKLLLEEKILQQKLQKEEENKTFIFPLSDAISREFFAKIFKDWTGKEKGDKKDKKEKEDKRDTKDKDNKHDVKGDGDKKDTKEKEDKKNTKKKHDKHKKH